MQRELHNLQSITPRAEWLQANRAALLEHMKTEAGEAPVRVGVFDYFSFTFQSLRQPLFHPAVVMLLMLGVFVGSGFVVNAAFYALPGQSLYRVKLALERTQLAITPAHDKKTELNIQFAKNRVDEFDKIVDRIAASPAAQDGQLVAAVQEFRKNVSDVRDHLATLKPGTTATSDKELTLRIAMTVQTQADSLAKTLDQTSQQLSQDDKQAVAAIIADAVSAAQATVQAVGEATQTSVASTTPAVTPATATTTIPTSITSSPAVSAENHSTTTPAVPVKQTAPQVP